MNSIYPQLVEAWKLAWKAIDLEPPDRAFHDAVGAYQERTSRDYYHGILHLSEVATLFKRHVGHFQSPGEAGIAIFYHDFVYVPGDPENEQKSADKAVGILRMAGATAGQEQITHSLILATRHSAATPPRTKDERLIVDIDLAILGATPARYDDYARGVRKEFKTSTPQPAFNLKRCEFLESLLLRPSIFNTDRFRAELEESARANIHREILSLTASP